jgi:hypothetical protein
MRIRWEEHVARMGRIEVDEGYEYERKDTEKKTERQRGG